MQHLSAFLSAFVDFTVTGQIRPPPSAESEAEKRQFIFPHAARLVAIGDLHGDLKAAQRAFRLAGLVDAQGKWCGGTTVCVQVGDLLDRGLEEIPLLYWMEQVAAEARQQGGRVHILNGNHEFMNIGGRFRYAAEDSAPSYDTYMNTVRFAEDLKRRCGQPHVTFPPPADTIAKVFHSRFAALRPGGPLTSRFLADKNTIVRVGDTFFVHAGLLPHHVDYGLQRINNEARSWVSHQPGAHRPSYLNQSDSPVWTRLYSHPDESKVNCEPLEDVFRRTGARRIVVGHSIHPLVTARCKGGVLCADVGLGFQPKKGIQVVEIINDNEVRVLANPGPDGRATLVVPLTEGQAKL